MIPQPQIPLCDKHARTRNEGPTSSLCWPSDPSRRAGTTQPPSQTSPARPLRPELAASEWEEKNLSGKQPGQRKGQQTPTEGHRGPHSPRGTPMGKQGGGKQHPSLPLCIPLPCFSQEASTLQTLPEGRRHFHEAVITRTERSSLPEPAGWSLFPLPFVFMHHSSHLPLRFLRALKKPHSDITQRAGKHL